jgi:uncharacterized protein YuzE
MEKSEFSYDSYSDSIIISKKQDNEIIKNNFEVGNIIFSLTGRGKIAGIEIREFSSFLESCNLNPLLAEKICEAELNVVVKRETVFLLLRISFNNNETTITENIPLVLPLINL